MTVGRAFWTVAPGQGEIRSEPIAPPGPDAVLLHAVASGVSRGTEATVFAGRVPASQYETMRAPLMGGAFPFPVKYGYSMVARTAGEQRVFVLHPHQDIFTAPAQMCVPVPDALPTVRAVLAANMETALNVVWDAAPLPGERMMVVGAGVVGLLVTYLLVRIPGAAVSVVDPLAERREIAVRFGAVPIAPESAPAEQELIVHASGNPAALPLALRCAAPEARIIEASWFGDRDVPLPLGEAFHARRLRLMSSQVGAVSPAMRGRRTHAQRLSLALDLLHDPVLDALLEPATPFDTLPDAMPRLLQGGLCHVVTYRS